MRKHIKLCASLFALLFIFTSCSDSKKQQRRDDATDILYAESDSILPYDITQPEQREASQSSFGLCYSTEQGDSLNPYTCTSNFNATISTLMFDPLVRVGPDYHLEHIIANKIKIEGKIITVEIKGNILFSDGSKLIPEDVVYSYSAAATEESRFHSQLLPVINCKSEGNNVIFELISEDKMASYLLNFPIIKRSSNLSAETPPIGSGRYVYVSDRKLGTYLQSNRWWYSDSESAIKRIMLLKMPSMETVIKSVEIGTLSFYYTDLREGTPARINAGTSLVDLNNIVYLGVNTNNELLSKIEIRRAISNALDRTNISTKAYNGRANPATGPFTPKWYETEEIQLNSVYSDKNLAEADLSAAGFVNFGSDSIRNNGSEALSFTLLVNGDNKPRMAAANMIAEQLKVAGINLVIESAGTQTYLSRVRDGKYQLYLGEYSLNNNMNLIPLITDSGYYKGPAPFSTQKAFDSWRKGEAELSVLVDAFNSELPFIPVCYRMGLTCYTRTLQGDIQTTADDPFYNIQEWKITK